MTLMNKDERERFLATLRSDDDFRATVRRELLTEELLNLPQTVAVLVDASAQQRQDFTALAQSMAVLVDASAQQRQDFTALAQSVANYMERTISTIQEGFAAVRGELSNMGTDMDAGFTAVNAKFDQVDVDLRDIRDQLAS